MARRSSTYMIYIEVRWEKGKEVWSPDRSQTPISSTLNAGSLKRQLYTLSYDAIHTNIIHTAIEHFIQIGKVILFFWHSSSPKFTALLYPYTRKIGIDLKSGFTQQKNRSILPLNYKINYWNETQFYFFWKKTKKAVNIILLLKNESSSIMLKAGRGV